jgi:hypothetical protein
VERVIEGTCRLGNVQQTCSLVNVYFREHVFEETYMNVYFRERVFEERDLLGNVQQTWSPGNVCCMGPCSIVNVVIMEWLFRERVLHECETCNVVNMYFRELV